MHTLSRHKTSSHAVPCLFHPLLAASPDEGTMPDDGTILVEMLDTKVSFR